MICQFVVMFCYLACVCKKTIVAFTLSLSLCFAFLFPCFCIVRLSLVGMLVIRYFGGKDSHSVEGRGGVLYCRIKDV